ncbi:MAG: phosphopantothenoylcysteine decarboxylase domain-containing protein [Planctomycetota bacterium]|jgi:phosphopantothenoylcysteine decarboxylase/phosphopantothenate--cysteine ligase
MQILITAGGTREYIDPVRFISNASSGKMGCALARAAIKAGHKVTLIAAPMTQHPPDAAKIVTVETAMQMFEAVKKHFALCDCLIMAAAVADYAPSRPAKAKLKKSDQCLTIKLRPTPDILRWAGKNKQVRSKKRALRKAEVRQGKRRILVGFALEDRAVRFRAEQKLIDKKLDMIVTNYPAAIGADKSDIQIKTIDSPWFKIENATKAAAAKKIIHLAEELNQAKFS